MPSRIPLNDFYALLARESNGALSMTRPEIVAIAKQFDVSAPYRVFEPEHKLERGLYNIAVGRSGIINETSLPAPAPEPVIITAEPVPLATPSFQNFVPDIDKNFVKWGNYKELETVMKSRMFFPVYVTGETGNGKTTSIVQAAAKLKREVIRINFTSETCEEDLLGSYTLRDGNTVWQDGPVAVAMKKGALCLLDEFDLSNPNRITCLNAVLEGNPVFIKRTGELVYPQPGFNIVATANTKGKGGSGRYIGANSQNEAVLDRFAITIEQNYAGKATEKRILTNVMGSITSLTEDDEQFIGKLVEFGDIIRATYNDGGVEELLSTRRLIDMCRTYVVFGRDRAKAIQYGINRFDVDTVEAFNSLYENLDERMLEMQNLESDIYEAA